jgi:hypothetical protein
MIIQKDNLYSIQCEEDEVWKNSKHAYSVTGNRTGLFYQFLQVNNDIFESESSG